MRMYPPSFLLAPAFTGLPAAASGENISGPTKKRAWKRPLCPEGLNHGNVLLGRMPMNSNVTVSTPGLATSQVREIEPGVSELD
jgi:hypothetical protein